MSYNLTASIPPQSMLCSPRMIPLIRIMATALTGLLLTAAVASAHPHVWVTMKSAVVYGPDGSITGVRHAWAFDDMYSAFATQGLESKKKGEFTPEELKPLANSIARWREMTFRPRASRRSRVVSANDSRRFAAL